MKQSTRAPKDQLAYDPHSQGGGHCIVALDINTNVLHVSPAITALLGYSPQEYTQHFIDSIHKDHIEQLNASIAYLADTKDAQRSIETLVRHKNGEWRWVNISLSNLTLKDQTIILANLHDVTDRRETQKKMHERLLALTAHNAYLEALQQTAVALNKRLEIMPLLNTILEHAATIANTSNGYIYLEDDAKENLVVRVGIGVFKNHIGTTLKKGEGMGGRVWQTGEAMTIDDYDNWSGRSKRIQTSLFKAVVGVPLTSNGQTIGVIALAYTEDNRVFDQRDIYALKQLAELASIALDNARLYQQAQQEIKERKLLSQREQYLLELNRTKDEFISLASHQLRTPATSVKQYINILLDGFLGRLTREQEDMLRIAHESNERQLKIISDLLRVAKLDSGTVSLNLEEIDIQELLEDIILNQALSLKQKQQVLRYKPLKEYPMIMADGDRLRMVFENIIDNASKYSLNDTTIKVSVRTTSKYLIVRISDNGVGIKATEYDKLFIKFSRIDNPLSTKVSGTGLGLYWAKKIIDLHNGIISVKSVEGVGTTFDIKLPLTV